MDIDEAKKLCKGVILILVSLVCFIKVGFSNPTLLWYFLIGLAISGAVIFSISFTVNAIFKFIERKKKIRLSRLK